MITVAEITLDNFKSWFTRDFDYATPYGMTGPIDDCPKTERITDADLTKAYSEAEINFNPSLFSTDTQLKVTFLYLAAHYLANDRQAATTQGAPYSPVQSRSVGPVSESYVIPDWMKNDVVLGSFMTTRYGQKYLTLIKPLLIGNVVVYEGATTYR
jgi:hypothetical protein